MMVAAICARFRALLEPIARCLKLAEVEIGHPCQMIGFGQKRRITTSFRQRDHLLDETRCPAEVGAHVIDVAESSQGSNEISLALQLTAKLLCTLECRFSL